jgi:Mg/Co/Ni transporter MgtE
MKTPEDKIADALDDVSDKDVARILQQYGTHRGIPTLSYSSEDVWSVAIGLATRKTSRALIEDMVNSFVWDSIICKVQDVFEDELYKSVRRIMKNNS